MLFGALVAEVNLLTTFWPRQTSSPQVHFGLFFANAASHMLAFFTAERFGQGRWWLHDALEGEGPPPRDGLPAGRKQHWY